MADRTFAVLCFGATLIGVILLVLLLGKILLDGYGKLSPGLLTRMPSYSSKLSGINSAIVGSFAVILLTVIIAVPVGVAAAIYLEEFTRRRTRFTEFIQVNIANLAGVPSIVYGLLGLALFVRWMNLGTSVIAGALTMALLILPTVIIVSQEALRAVPSSLREASLALGTSQWQTIRSQVLPSALPGVLTGVILSVSRALGETAPLIVVGAVSYVNFAPKDLNSSYTVLPLLIFSWSSRPEKDFHQVAAAAIIVLLVVLLTLNSFAIWLRARTSR